MNILVVGNGGREHAIAYWLSKSMPSGSKLYCVPGNPGISVIAECAAIKAEPEPVAAFAKEKNIDFAVIGPEAPLCAGVSDALREIGVAVFGPSKEAAQLEGSKDFAKQFMVKYGIPTAKYQTFTEEAPALDYVNAEYDANRAVVVKADGLAAGKGVIVAENRQMALDAVKECFAGAFGKAGARVVIEELLEGEEASILALTDGKTIIPLASSQDHKRLLDGDMGPNTGGMGAYSPAPVVTDELMATVKELVLDRFLTGVKAENLFYRGVIYAGIMVTKDGPKVLEFNVRFGDPETQAVLSRLDSSLCDALYKTAVGEVDKIDLVWSKDTTVCVVLASGGYPGTIDKGHVITGLEDAWKAGAYVFHAGTADESGKVVNSGGRVLGVTVRGEGIADAIRKVYEIVPKIKFAGMQYRKDIAHRALERLEK